MGERLYIKLSMGLEMEKFLINRFIVSLPQAQLCSEDFDRFHHFIMNWPPTKLINQTAASKLGWTPPEAVDKCKW